MKIKISVRYAKKYPLNMRKKFLKIRKNVHKKCEKINEVKERFDRKEKWKGTNKLRKIKKQNVRKIEDKERKKKIKGRNVGKKWKRKEWEKRGRMRGKKQ